MTIVKETKIMGAGWGDMEERKLLCTQKLKIQLPYDPAILLLNIYSKEMKTERNTPMLTCALFTTAYAFKQPMAFSWWTDE